MLEELDSMQFLKTTVYWALRFAAYSAWKGEKWGRAGRGRAGRARSARAESCVFGALVQIIRWDVISKKGLVNHSNLFINHE